MSLQTNVPVVNDLQKDLAKIFADLSLIDGDIPLTSLSSSNFSGRKSDGLDEYLSAKSGPDNVSQNTTAPQSFDSPVSRRKAIFNKKRSKKRTEKNNLDGFKIGDRVVIWKDRIAKIRRTIYEGKSGSVTRATKLYVWVLLDFNGEVKQKANHMVSHDKIWIYIRVYLVTRNIFNIYFIYIGD